MEAGNEGRRVGLRIGVVVLGLGGLMVANRLCMGVDWSDGFQVSDIVLSLALAVVGVWGIWMFFRQGNRDGS